MNNIQTKFLLTIEFRYNDSPKYNGESEQCICKTITLGVFDTRDEANLIGNKAMEIFESKFKLNPNWNKKERFSNNGGCFGSAHDLISDLGYLQTPFSFYAKIKKLEYIDLEQSIDNVLNAITRYKEYKKNNKDN